MVTEDEAENDPDLVPIPEEWVLGNSTVFVRPCILGSIVWLLESFEKYHTVPIRVVSAWRSPEHQDRLRQAHCSTPLGIPEGGDYEDYTSCAPPTAYPGRSMHQSGLAIDFYPCTPPVGAEAYAFTPRDVPCFNWFINYASKVGLYTPDRCRSSGGCDYYQLDFKRWYEPWHWSVDGT